MIQSSAENMFASLYRSEPKHELIDLRNLHLCADAAGLHIAETVSLRSLRPGSFGASCLKEGFTRVKRKGGSSDSATTYV